jgi:hypothetical protein
MSDQHIYDSHNYQSGGVVSFFRLNFNNTIRGDYAKSGVCFGSSVAISESCILVGDYSDSSDGDYSGSALFVDIPPRNTAFRLGCRPIAGTGIQTAKLSPSAY